MNKFRKILQKVVRDLESHLEANPLAILNESEFQALLHHFLLEAMPQRPRLALAPEVINPRKGASYTCRRVYRELKTKPGRNGKEVDLIVLRNAPQKLIAKKNGAPSMFARPYEAIIETKVDATNEDILSGRNSRSRLRDLQKDLDKWSIGDDAENIVGIVYTDNPRLYADDERVITIRRPSWESPGREPKVARSDVQKGVQAYKTALADLSKKFEEQPYWYLREKDFETALFVTMRQAISTPKGEMSPVRSQWLSKHSHVLGKRRRHDVVILDHEATHLALELELKTSHSMNHNWFRKPDVKSEFESMQILRDAGLLDRAVFVMFRIGKMRWKLDADSLTTRFPTVEIDYRCTER